MKVPVFRLEYSDDFITRYQEGCANILRSDRLAEGHYVRRFEEEFARFIGVKYAIAVGSGTDALEVALRAIDVRGKDVIVPTNTFIATALAAKMVGSNVRLVDIEDETFALNPIQLCQAITKNTGAVIVVHIGGLISKNITTIVKICDDAGVPLLEDAAHAHGSSMDSGRLRAGAIGIAGCFSFFPTKVMTTGEGGMITTNDEALAHRMRAIKDFGRTGGSSLAPHYLGINAKVTEFQGLLGCLEMERLMRRLSRRWYLAGVYEQLLSDSQYDVVTPGFRACSAYYKQIVKIPGCQLLLHKYCRAHGVELTGEVYRKPLHRQPVLGLRGKFPIADHFANHHICPPLYPELSADEVIYVCDVLKGATFV